MLLTTIEKLSNIWFALIPRTKPSSRLEKRARLIAHRGAHDNSANIIENTFPAFEKALDLGCWGIEMDVHSTKDKKLIVNHDPTLKRFWHQNLTIAQTDLATIQARAPMVPTLEGVVERFGKRLHLFIELKKPFDAEKALVEALKSLTPCKDYHLISLDESTINKLKLFPREALLLVPMPNNYKSYTELSLKKGYGGLMGHYLLLNDRIKNRLKESQQIMGVGFVDSKNSLYRELNREIDYIITNKAEKISPLLTLH